MLNVRQRTSRVCSHTVALFRKHCTGSLVITHSLKSVQLRESPSAFSVSTTSLTQLVTGMSQRNWREWLKTSIPPDWSLQANVNQPPYAVRCGRRVLIQTCRGRYSSGHVWSQLPASSNDGLMRKERLYLAFHPSSPWTSETAQWKLSMLQLICCRC